MRLYKITANNGVLSASRFVGSKDEGVQYRKALADAGYRRKEVTEVEVNIPTDKEGLLAYLNGGA